MQTHHVVLLNLHIDSHLCPVSILVTTGLTFQHITARSRRKRKYEVVLLNVLCSLALRVDAVLSNLQRFIVMSRAHRF